MLACLYKRWKVKLSTFFVFSIPQVGVDPCVCPYLRCGDKLSSALYSVCLFCFASFAVFLRIVKGKMDENI